VWRSDIFTVRFTQHESEISEQKEGVRGLQRSQHWVSHLTPGYYRRTGHVRLFWWKRQVNEDLAVHYNSDSSKSRVRDSSTAYTTFTRSWRSAELDLWTLSVFGLGFNSISEVIGIINAKLNISPPHDSLPGNVKGDSLENVANQFFVHTMLFGCQHSSKHLVLC